MTDDIDDSTKLKIYLLILNRYKDLISEKESKSISEIRKRVSPYSDEVRKISNLLLLGGLQPYSYDRDFYLAAEKAINFIRGIRTCRFMIPFWMNFDEILEVEAAGPMDKALLLTALLRSFGSEDALVVVTKSSRPFVSFSWKGERYVFAPDSGSLLSGEDIKKIFMDDPPHYSFNDLKYEDYSPSR